MFQDDRSNPEKADHDPHGEFAKDFLQCLDAKPISDEEFEADEYEPFVFIGGPMDGDTMPNSEKRARFCCAAAGVPFNGERHTVGCLVPMDDGVYCHTYSVDWAAKVYRYVGPDGMILRRTAGK